MRNPGEPGLRGEGSAGIGALGAPPKSTKPGHTARASLRRQRTWIKLAEFRVLRPALGGPGAGAAAAAPLAPARGADQAAGAQGALLAVDDLDRHRAIGRDLAGDVERGVAGVDQVLALDVDRVAVSAIAI